MRKIINFAVKNPVTISMLVLAILLLGFISYDRLNVDLLPKMNAPRLFIEIEAGERPPEEIEKLFIESMESTAIRQRDVTQVSSVIKAGSARITVEYAQKKDMDEAFLDLQKAMAIFAANQNIRSLNITQYDPNTAPVMLIAMSHSTITDMAELRKMAESYVRNELVRLEGVAEVALSGQERSILTINTDAYMLKAFDLTVDEIGSRIEQNNQSISGGRVSDLGLQYLVKSTTQFTNEADFENLIVSYKATETATGGASTQRNADRAPVYLREVATVKFENERPENIVRLNGDRCIGLSVYKEMQQNTVRVVERINNQLVSLEQALPGYNFKVISNQGTFINDAIGEVKNSALLGMALAVLILFVFLRRIGTTLIISVSIPVSIIATFNLMYFNGLTLNVMTLGGLALGAGMLIDNAIVVIESIFRNHERGMERNESIVTGTAEVSGAVVASTITTIIVFLPIVYLHGASGELFKDQALTVAFSLIASLFVALLVIPMLYDKITGGKKYREEMRSMRSIRFNWYGKILKSLLKFRWPVILVSLALLAGTVLLLPYVGSEFLPRSESRTFTVSVKLPEGTRLERTDAVVQNLEYLIYSISGDSLCTVYTHAGTGSSESEEFEGEHTAMMKVVLSKSSPLSPETVIERFMEVTRSIEGLELTFRQEEITLGSLFSDETAPIVVEVKGESLEEIAAITDDVLIRLQNVDGIFNVKSSIADGAPELIIVMDRVMTGINNINISSVINQIRQKLQGRDAGKLDYRGEMRDIVIKTPDITTKDLLDIVIRSGNQEFLLREIATVQRSYAPKEIFRRNQSRINKIIADKDMDKSLDKVAQQIRQTVVDIDLPANYSITVTGEEEKRQDSMSSLLWALSLSILLVYMVLASQFESLLHPFTILLTIPFALIGSILIFFISGTTINIMGIIGIIMLGGIAVNNSIILVVRINQLKTAMKLVDAIIQAGQQRIRPIIMTSMTTILALLPMSLSIGEGAALRSSMAIAVIGGLFTSTLMSLVVIPCVYFVFEQMKQKITRE